MLYINEYIERQTIDNQAILYALREIIINFDSNVEEKFKYKIPYYHYRGKSFCYLNINKNDEVDLGLVNGNQMIDNYGFLEGEHLKTIRHLKFNSVEDELMTFVNDYLEQGRRIIDKKLDK